MHFFSFYVLKVLTSTFIKVLNRHSIASANMTAPYKYLIIENIEKLRKIIINNPARKNALPLEAYQELTDAINNAATDNTVSIIALTGAGDFYSSGNDLSGMLRVEDPKQAMEESRPKLKAIIKAFSTCPKLLISVVNGPCIGIAATLTALCDIIYAVETAYFYTPFSMLGLCAEGCASYTFPKIVGKSKATEMLLLNYKLPANEAYTFNLVSKVYKKPELDTILWPQLVQQSRLPVDSLKVTKNLMQRFESENLQRSCDFELIELYKRFESMDFIEALMNFMQRKSKL